MQEDTSGEINRKLVEEALVQNKITVTQQDLDTELATVAEYFGFRNADGSRTLQHGSKMYSSGRLVARTLLSRRNMANRSIEEINCRTGTSDEDDLQKGFESNYGPRADVLAIVLSNQRTAQEVWN